MSNKSASKLIEFLVQELKEHKGHPLFRIFEDFSKELIESYSKSLQSLSLEDPAFSLKAANYKGMIEGLKQFFTSINYHLEKGGK